MLRTRQVHHMRARWGECKQPVATLMFVTSTVILACVVVDYTIDTFEQTLYRKAADGSDTEDGRHYPKPDR